MKIFHPTYFPSIRQFALMSLEKELVFEVNDNFQKQTYRNRCYIYGANGKQLLNIPIQKISGKQLTKDVKIDYGSNWQMEHLKSLHSAYRSSPFFEFYIDDLEELFTKKETFLLDLNIQTIQKVMDALQLKVDYLLSKSYEKDLFNDYRFLVNAKSKEKFNFPTYTQVFNNKHGFIENLSILDLLFLEGPASELYIKKLMNIK